MLGVFLLPGLSALESSGAGMVIQSIVLLNDFCLGGLNSKVILDSVPTV